MSNKSVLVLVTIIAVLSSTGGETAELCNGDGDCSGSDACVGGACVAAVPDLDQYLTEAQSRWSSFVWAVQFPALFEPTPELCCFDYTGDGVPDDALGNIVALSVSLDGGDPNGDLQQAIEDGALVKVFDWRELAPDLAAGDVQVSVFDGELSGAMTFDDRKAGLGHVLLSRSSFGSHGAIDQLNGGSVSSGLVDVTGNGFELELPFMSLMLGGQTTSVRLLDPRLRGPVAYDNSPGAPCQGLCTVDDDRGPGHTPQIVGGAWLGGVIPIADFLEHMDAFYRKCDCAGIDPDQPVIVWGENAGNMTFDVSCTANIGDPLLCDPADPCSELNMVCSFMGLLPQTLDVDYDRSGINESYSVGLRIAWSGTTLDGLTGLFVDGFESGNTSAWTNAVP